MRKISKPSTAQCNLEHYTLFLLSEPKHGGCCRLAEILENVSHDSVNRFLSRERYEPKDLFDSVKEIINIVGGILSVDDTVIEKLYSDPKNAELIGYFWSGKYHKSIKGLNLITLYYSDVYGNSVPINYRIYDKKEGKTKNDYFQEMLKEVIDWGVQPRIVTGDSWYSGVENLKFLRNQKLGFLFGIEKNRTVSNEPGKYCQVRSLEISDEGLRTHLREFGFIKLFRKDFKKEDSRHYILYLPDEESLQEITRSEFVTIHDTHWGIESFHRAIKQVCGICRFMVRDSQAIKTHIFCSLQAFVRLEKMRSENIISNWYEVQRNLFTLVVRDYIVDNLTNACAASST
ncbi:transposase [Aphanizomenon sp. CS-733/32]|uniref:IS701 family transposase n=1 Tax=Aphanizomenon sp. CS-733/32 TaxID=3021715 RepID=UPI00232D988B|nr:transposase [Aphanizomenon sp. CS-733/32]MDB9307743.1 transposase [Aphanizomenon sp. CS-733/32]